MPSIFTRIIEGEIPCYKIAEDEKHFAFLDINPLRPGHTLVVPKEEVDYIFDLPVERLAELHQFSQGVAKAIEKVVPCERIGVTVIGLEVPHAHIHLIPIRGIADMEFSRPKVKLSKEEFEDIATKISKAYTAV
ncbi:MAG: HIT family protein [Saprospiraceae bacterium]|jgi:histidine triad (HIT) family protein